MLRRLYNLAMAMLCYAILYLLASSVLCIVSHARCFFVTAWIPVWLQHLSASRNIRSVECKAASSSVTVLCCLCSSTTKRLMETPKDLSWLFRKQMVRLEEKGEDEWENKRKGIKLAGVQETGMVNIQCS